MIRGGWNALESSLLASIDQVVAARANVESGDCRTAFLVDFESGGHTELSPAAAAEIRSQDLLARVRSSPSRSWFFPTPAGVGTVLNGSAATVSTVSPGHLEHRLDARGIPDTATTTPLVLAVTPAGGVDQRGTSIVRVGAAP